MSPRTIAFVVVGAGGFLMQLTVLATLTGPLGWPVPLATAIAVEAAVLANFWCHERWTWRDRRDRDSRGARLWRFHAMNGATSLVGNVVLTSFGVMLGINAPLANTLAVGVLAAINYVTADRWVFTRRAGVAMSLLALTPSAASAAELQRETIEAWDKHIARVEAGLRGSQTAAPILEPAGNTLGVAGGIIHEWRGSVLVPNCTVSALVNGLANPGTPPPQDDVLESRVLERHGNSLRVYLKVVRTAIVTVTYDTEHRVQFDQTSPSMATSRSVATRIVETGGEDHGFLWRLNSYWRYRQVGDSVQVDVLSVSLSRGMPALLKPVASPLVSRVARESMMRTLDAVKRFGEGLADRSAISPARMAGR
jgi:putative flippase GtrA